MVINFNKTFNGCKYIYFLISQGDNAVNQNWNPLLKTHWEGFPGGTVVENLPANAGDTGSSPGLGRSHMPRSDWAREPQLLNLRVWSLCSATREAVILRGPRTAMKSGPCLPQLEKALAQKWRPNVAINQSINKINKSLKNKKLTEKILNFHKTNKFLATIHQRKNPMPLE